MNIHGEISVSLGDDFKVPYDYEKGTVGSDRDFHKILNISLVSENLP